MSRCCRSASLLAPSDTPPRPDLRRVVADPFATGLHRFWPFAMLSHGCHKLTRGHWGRK